MTTTANAPGPPDSAARVHVLGVRHHGPGSARSVRKALGAIGPSIVLVEGPPDADAMIPLMGVPAMTPPVALLVYGPEAPRESVYSPFAEFSPEWQALTFALARETPARFMDLPVSAWIARDESAGPPPPRRRPADPLG